MAVGQGVLRVVLDVGALAAVEARLEQHKVARSAVHAALLGDVLELHRVHTAGGCALATVAQLALLTRSSEFRAGALLADAQLLAGLPGALEALDCGLLTVEQAGWSAPSSARSISRSGLLCGIGCEPGWSPTTSAAAAGPAPPHAPPAGEDRSPPRRLSPPPEDDGDDHDWPYDPAGLELRADDTEPADDHDRTGEHIQHTDTRWSLELDNPYLWLPEADLLQ